MWQVRELKKFLSFLRGREKLIKRQLTKDLRYEYILKRILYEDNHIIIYNKPSGLSIQPSQSIIPLFNSSIPSFPSDSVYNDLKFYLQQKYLKSGNVYLGIVHRLDKLTSGLILFAKTSKSASRLSQSFLKFQVKKKYVALAHGIIDIPVVLEDYINDTTNPVKITSRLKYDQSQSNYKDYKFSSCSILPLCQFSSLGPSKTFIPPKCTALDVELRTGRKHQIRSQLSSHGYPILGDIKYQAPCRNHFGYIGLHAYHISFPHPITKEMMSFQSPLPSEWKSKFITPSTYELITSLLDPTNATNR